MGLDNLSTKRQRIAELARTKRGVALSTLHHVIDLEWLKEAYRLTRKDGAPGIDGMTAKDYAQNLEANLSDLLERIKSGRYQAPPVRRAYIPKADGSRRPLGLPTFEDKVCQRAIVMILELVYEQEFLPCSYGFRPGRSAHQALHELRTGFMSHGLRWVIDLDIVKYFDSISHSHLRSFLDRRVTDGVIRRMIDKWLKAGVLEDGLLRHATEGSPQGGVVSPHLGVPTPSRLKAVTVSSSLWGTAVGPIRHRHFALGAISAPAAPPAWLKEADTDFYVGEFKRTGCRASPIC